MGLRIMPPDIHESGSDYTVVENGIRLGLEAIKGIGPAASAAIQEHRPFQSYQAFCNRVPARAVNINGRAALVMSGAFDRWQMRSDFTEDKIDELERELLGMSLTSVYSVEQYADIVEGKFWTEDEFDAAPEDSYVAVVGEVTALKEHIDRKGNTMAFVDLAYGPNHWSCTLFSYIYAEFKDLLMSRRPVLITGVKNTYNNRSSIRAQAAPGEDSIPPVMDLQDYAELIADVDEGLAQDSIYPEDLQESLGITQEA